MDDGHPYRPRKIRTPAVVPPAGRKLPTPAGRKQGIRVPAPRPDAHHASSANGKAASTAIARRPPEISLSVRTNRYGSIKRHSLRERLRQVNEHEKDVMDLTPEATLLRALILDFVEDYDATKCALLEWHAAMQEGTNLPLPARLPDLMDVQKLVEGVGKLISRAHAINQTGTVSLAVFRRAVELMGSIVATYVQDQTTLNKIEQAWGHIALDPKGKKESYIDAEIVEDTDASV